MKQPDDVPRVGEWAMVIHEHCAHAKLLGIVVKVVSIEPPRRSACLRCVCGEQYALGESHAEMQGRKQYHPLRWLKRLPPPDQVIGHDFVRAGGLKARTVEEAMRIAEEILK